MHQIIMETHAQYSRRKGDGQAHQASSRRTAKCNRRERPPWRFAGNGKARRPFPTGFARLQFCWGNPLMIDVPFAARVRPCVRSRPVRPRTSNSTEGDCIAQESSRIACTAARADCRA